MVLRRESDPLHVMRRETDPLFVMRRETDPITRPRSAEPRGVLSAAFWLKIARGSLVLALIAATALYLHRNPPSARVQTDEDQESSFIAPRGTLDMSAEFALIEKYADTPAPKQEALPDPEAPPRMLDPVWNPSFNGG